jgi:hypothetical protein
MSSGRKLKFVFVVLCSVVGSGAIWLILSRLRTAQADTARASKELATLKEDIRNVAAERAQSTVIYQVPRTERPADVAPAVSAAAPAPPDPLIGLSPDEKRYRLGVINDAQAELVHSTWEREPPDPGWSAKATQLLQSRYQGDDFRGVGVSAACRSTMCKISVTSADAMQGEKALHRVVETQPWPSPGFGHFDREKQQGFVYLAREGTELPKVDPASLTF